MSLEPPMWLDPPDSLPELARPRELVPPPLPVPLDPDSSLDAVGTADLAATGMSRELLLVS